MSYRDNELTKLLRGVTTPYAVMGVGLPKSGKSEVLSRMSVNLGVRIIDEGVVLQELATAGLSREDLDHVLDDEIAAILSSGDSVIVDGRHIDPVDRAAHPEYRRRSQLIEAYKEFGAKAVMAVSFTMPLDRILERVSPDALALRGKLTGLHQNLTQNPVTLAEGFDLIATKDGYARPVRITGIKPS